LSYFLGYEHYDLSPQILVGNQVQFLLSPQMQNVVLIFFYEIGYAFLNDWPVRKSALVVQAASTFQMKELARVILSVVRKATCSTFGA